MKIKSVFILCTLYLKCKLECSNALYAFLYQKFTFDIQIYDVNFLINESNKNAVKNVPNVNHDLNTSLFIVSRINLNLVGIYVGILKNYSFD